MVAYHERERTQLADHAVEGVILLVIVLEGQDLDKNRQDLLEGDALAVLQDHAAETASGVVLKTGDVHVEALLEAAEDSGEFLHKLSASVGVLHQTTNGVGGVGAGLGVLVTKTVHKQLQEARGEGGDRSAHAVDALGEDTNSGGTLERLRAAGIAENGFLEHLPQLGEAVAQGGGHTRNNVETSVDDDPVKFRGLLTGSKGLVLGAELKLARVLLGDDVGDHGDDVVQGGLVGNQSGTAVAKVLRHVAVDVGDGSTRYQLVSSCLDSACRAT